VALTGNGADEIFGGYNRHVLLPKVWRALRPLPLSGRRGLGHVFAIMQRAVAGEQNALHQVTRRLGLPLTTLDKLGQVGSAIAGARDSSDFYRAMVSMVPDSARLVLRPGAAATLPAMEGVDLAQWTMAMDTLDFLPGDVLVKVDRAAMSASLETRAPFLDRRVVELAWRLPLGAKIKGRTGKRILRDILVRHVPRALTDRPKQGFAIPIDQWLRGALRDWAEHQLAPAQLVAGGIVDVGKVRRLWEDHLGNRANAGPQLWNVLMFQSWLEHQAAQREPSVQAARRA
jgi:asparagine synthase (glutamine-hydrolysing)